MSTVQKSAAEESPFVTQNVNRGVLLCCPYCRCPKVHAAEVHVEQQHSRTKVMKDFTSVTRSGRQGVGAEIILDFWCEEGHTFEYSFDFRRDRVYVSQVSDKVDLSEPYDEF